MIDQALTQDGKRISISEAIEARDIARLHRAEEQAYLDPADGETVIPRKGHKTLLSQAKSHFYHPGEIEETELGFEKAEAIGMLEQILAKTGEFTAFKSGLLDFYDLKSAIVHDSLKPDFNYGFHILWGKKADNTEYGFVVLNRVPHSDNYLKMLRALSSEEKFEGRTSISKSIISPKGEVTRLGDKIHLTTVQLKNGYLYRPNREENHPENALLLGDWQAKHLLLLYPQFVYLDMEKGALDVVNLQRLPHRCEHSDIRYAHMGKSPEVVPEFCQFPVRIPEPLTIEPLVVPKDAYAEAIKSHPRLKLAAFVPKTQRGLF